MTKNDPRSLAGRTAVVTGGSSGIGRASAVLLAQRGASVVVVGRRASALDATVQQIAGDGGVARAVVADVQDGPAVRDLVAQTEEWFGSVDVVLANAGISGPNVMFADYPDDAFDEVVAVNLRGTFLTLKHALPAMAARGSGSIVVMGSLGSARGLPTSAAYNASKHAIVGLARTAAVEYGGRGVRVNAVLAGWVDTPLSRAGLESFAGSADAGLALVARTAPAARVASPDEIAEVVAFLASDAAGYVNGAAWEVDGGVLATAGTIG